MSTHGIGIGDLVSFNFEGKPTRAIVVGSPIAGALALMSKRSPRPHYISREDATLLVPAGYNFEADDPILVRQIAIMVNQGMVEGVRASAPVAVTVIDLDIFDDCAGDEEDLCSIEEPPTQRKEHDDLRAAYEAAQALPLSVYA